MFRLSILDIPCRVLINAEITVRQAVLTVSAAYEAKLKKLATFMYSRA